MEKLCKRSKVPVEETWKIEDLYETEEALMADLKKMVDGAEEISKNYQGKLKAEFRDNILVWSA